MSNYCDDVRELIKKEFEKEFQKNKSKKKMDYIRDRFTKEMVGGKNLCILFVSLLAFIIIYQYMEHVIFKIMLMLPITTLLCACFFLIVFLTDLFFKQDVIDYFYDEDTYTSQYNWANFFNCDESDLKDNKRFRLSQLKNGNMENLSDSDQKPLKPIDEAENDFTLINKQKWANLSMEFLNGYKFQNNIPAKMRFLAENIKNMEEYDQLEFLWHHREDILFEANGKFKKQWELTERKLLSDWQVEIDWRYYGLARYLKETETLPDGNYQDKLRFIRSHESSVTLG